MGDQKLINVLALRILSDVGIGGIWTLYRIAVECHRTGDADVAMDLREMARIGEREWNRRQSCSHEPDPALSLAPAAGRL